MADRDETGGPVWDEPKYVPDGAHRNALKDARARIATLEREVERLRRSIFDYADELLRNANESDRRAERADAEVAREKHMTAATIEGLMSVRLRRLAYAPEPDAHPTQTEDET